MVAHVQLAALLTETVGALVLARSLAFEDIEQYVRGEGTPKWGFDSHADVARARAGAEAFGGLALVAGGLVGQAVVALAIGEPRGGWVAIPYAVGVVAIVIVWRRLIPGLIRRRVRNMARTRIALGSEADLGNAQNVAHALNGYSHALHIDGFSRPASYAVREHVEGVLGRELLVGLGEPAEQLRDGDWCPRPRPPH